MNTNVFKKYKIIFLPVTIFGLIITFQNCSRVSFQSLNEFYSQPLKSQNNGEGYGGKPEGDFYRFTPDFTCEQKEAPVAHINIKGSSVTLTENKKLLCGAVNQLLDSNLVDSSIYQQEVIGYQEGIFEGETTSPASIPANLVEVWCKDRNDEDGIETITHFDHTTNLALNRIYYTQDGAPKQIQDFSVARVAANKSVIVKDEKTFELTVHRDQASPQLGLFNAHLEATIEGRKITRETFCRLGGSLDPKIWPAKQIVDFNVKLFNTSPDLNSFGYTSNTATGIFNLYAAHSDGTQQMRAGPNLPIRGTSHFLFSGDSKSLIYAGDARLPGITELFKVNTDGSSQIQLSNLLINANQSVDNFDAFKLSPDGLSVIFGDASFSTFASAFSHTWLQSVPISGGRSPQILTPPPSLALQGAKAFAVSKNKVVFSCCDTVSDLYSVNTDGSGLLKISPPHDGQWVFEWLTPIVGNGGDYVYTLGSNKTTGPLRGYIVAIDGSGSVELSPGQIVDDSVLSENYALLYQAPCSGGSCVRQLLNLKTKTLINLPTLKGEGSAGSQNIDSSLSPRIFFTKDSTALIGSKILSDGNLQAVSISTTGGEVKDLCPGVLSPQLVIKEISQNNFLILTYDQNSQIVNVYMNTQDAVCKKVNSSVAIHPKMDFLYGVSISPDSKKIIIKLNAFGVDPYSYFIPSLVPKASQILYVPLNGQATFAVDTPVHDAATISQAVFLNDSRTVLFIGDQIRPSDQNIFLWIAP